MNAAVVEELKDSYMNFYYQNLKVFKIESEEAYEEALSVLDNLMSNVEDSVTDPLLPLVELVANAIEAYEDTLDEVIDYDMSVDAIDAGVATLRVLMDQHDLNQSAFEEEIGSNTYVSLILSGTRKLSKEHISKLATRFDISPALFF